MQFSKISCPWRQLCKKEITQMHSLRLRQVYVFYASTNTTEINPLISLISTNLKRLCRKSKRIKSSGVVARQREKDASIFLKTISVRLPYRCCTEIIAYLL